MDPAYRKGSGIGIYSLDEYLLSTYHVPGTVPDAGNSGVRDSVLTWGHLLPQGWRDRRGRKIYIKEEYNVRW